MSKRINILGKDNFVDSSADKILIVGNGNQVFGKVENIVIVGDNFTVKESNIVLIDGDIKRFNYNDAGNRVVLTDAANYNTDANTSYYLTDTTGNNTTFVLSFNEADYYPGMKFTFKKLYADNVILINAGAKTIDGNQYAVMYAENDVVEIVYDGYNWIKANQLSEDYHSGYKEISTYQTIRIAENKQMINYNNLTNNGTLIVDGDLILQ
jgi:hypothetical protein